MHLGARFTEYLTINLRQIVRYFINLAPGRMLIAGRYGGIGLQLSSRLNSRNIDGERLCNGTVSVCMGAEVVVFHSKLKGKYSLESTDPRESEIRAHLRP